MTDDKTLLISLGGAAQPVIYSILKNLPEKIIFFVSSDTRKKICEEVMPAVFEQISRIPDYETIITPDAQDVGICVRTLLSKVPEAMSKLGVSAKRWPDIVDYTGGTKTISSSMVWASAKYPCKLCYIGTINKEGRTKDGVGVVQDGRENVFIIENPWDKIAYFEVESAMLFFNQCQYASGAVLLKSILSKISDERLRILVSSLCGIVEGYAEWDAFDHKKAKHLLLSSFNKLQAISDIEQIIIPGLKTFIIEVADNLKFLENINPGRLSWPLIHDLLANSARRGLIEKKYEDASARCYAVIEKIAKHELSKYGIDTSNAAPERLPEECRAHFVRKYTSKMPDGTESLKFGVIASYDVLSILKNPFGERFNSIENIRDHLSERNFSILAHGIQPMDEAKFMNLLGDALKLLDISRDSLIKFPTFKL